MIENRFSGGRAYGQSKLVQVEIPCMYGISMPPMYKAISAIPTAGAPHMRLSRR